MQFLQIEWTKTNIAILWLSIGFIYWVYVLLVARQLFTKGQHICMLPLCLIFWPLFLGIKSAVKLRTRLRTKKYVVFATKHEGKFIVGKSATKVGSFRVKDDKEAERLFIRDYSSNPEYWFHYLELFQVRFFGQMRHVTDND